jgi:hypothetical protein
VAHSPLPLQLFFPGCLPPPWPLQSFLPLQECLVVSDVVSWATRSTPALAEELFAVEAPPFCTGCALRRADVPPAGGRAAKKTGECGGESEAVYSVAFHEEHLSGLGRAPSAPDVIDSWDLHLCSDLSPSCDCRVEAKRTCSNRWNARRHKSYNYCEESGIFLLRARDGGDADSNVRERCLIVEADLLPPFTCTPNCAQRSGRSTSTGA